MKFLFTTKVTMKPYNSKKWWIERNTIPKQYIEANNLEEAISIFADKCQNECINVSKTAIKNREPMYIDDVNTHEAIQTGYVFTASCDFEDEQNRKWVKQYIDLWTKIEVVNLPNFE